jgi:hypothetical protein
MTTVRYNDKIFTRVLEMHKKYHEMSAFIYFKRMPHLTYILRHVPHSGKYYLEMNLCYIYARTKARIIIKFLSSIVNEKKFGQIKNAA